MAVDFTEYYSFTNRLGETIDFDCGDGFYVLQRDGDGIVEHSVHTRKTPFQSGYSLIRARPNHRRLTVKMVLKGNSYEHLLNLQNRMAKVLNPALGEGVLTVSNNSGISNALRCFCVSGLDFPADAKVGPTARRVPLIFEAGDPFWYDPTIREIDFSGSGHGLRYPMTYPFTYLTTQPSVGAPSTITYAGTADTYPVVTITGPMVSPVIKNVDTGRYLKFNYTLVDGDSLIVDMAPGIKTAFITANGTVFNAMNVLTQDSLFWSLKEGTNTVLITCDGPIPGGEASIKYLDKYVSFRG